MTKNNGFKKQIRARMALTGETYAQARAALYKKKFPVDFLLSQGLSLPVNKPAEDLTIEDLFSGQELHTLKERLQARDTIIVAGGAATGKTFTLNAILNSYKSFPDGKLLLTLEETVNELKVSGTYQVPVLTGREDITSSVISAMRRAPEAIAIGEIRYDDLPILHRIRETGTDAYTTLHALSLVQLSETYSGRFAPNTTVVMVSRMKIDGQNYYFNAVVPLTREVREIMEDHNQNPDREKFYRSMDELGVVSIDTKRRELSKLGIENN